MALKLGELLVRKQMITEGQLGEALRAQQLFGGRLGTNLVELGYLTEHALSKFLSEQLGLPALGASDIESVSEAAISALPRELASKFRVIPLAVHSRRMRLAMADPTDLKAVDEISFTSGYSIQPVVAPELLINYALEKYYGVTRTTRYVRLTGTSDAEFQIVQTAQQSAEDATAAASGGPLRFEERSQYLQQERNDFAPATYSVPEACRDLAVVAEQKDVFEVLRKFFSQYFQRVAIFAVRGGALVGWVHVGCAMPPAEFSKVRLDAAESGLLLKGMQSSSPERLKLSSTPLHDWLAKLLSLSTTRELVSLPVNVNTNVVGVLAMAGRRSGELTDSLELFGALSTKASYALQLAYLRKRILET